MFYFRNAIYEKDRWAANKSRAFLAAILAANGILSVIAMAVFTGMVRYVHTEHSRDYSELLQLYLTMAMIEGSMIAVVTPVIAGISICQEGERGNLELFAASGVSPWEIVWGKLLYCMNMLTVLILTSLPVFSLAFVYGGIQLKDLMVLIGVLWLIGLEITVLSLLCSVGVSRLASAAVTAYGANLLWMGGTFLLHEMPRLMHQTGYKEQLGRAIAWYHYPLLANPAVTLYGVLNQQAGSRSAIFDMINYQGNYRQNWITENWLSVSFLIQTALMLAVLLLTVKKLHRQMYFIGRR